jgi:putative two-component system response regulator
VNRRIGELARSSQLSSLAMIETVSRLAPVAEHRYGGARDHIGRMSRYTAAIASRMGVDREGVETILLAAAMHDLGMVCIPGSILGKPGTFDAQERLVMQGHAELGAAFLAGSTVAHVRLGEIIARHHHENWDGSGYPAGLAGEDIPLEARMAAVADRFDALTSSRPWRPSLPLAQAMEIIRGERERRFDPEILDAFLANHEEIRVLDQGSEGWDRRGLPGPATDGSTGS